MNRNSRRARVLVVGPVRILAPTLLQWLVYLAVLVALIALHFLREQLGITSQVVGAIRFLIGVLAVSGAIMLKIFVFNGWG